MKLKQEVKTGSTITLFVKQVQCEWKKKTESDEIAPHFPNKYKQKRNLCICDEVAKLDATEQLVQ